MVITYAAFFLKLEVDTVIGQKTLEKSLSRQYKNKIESYIGKDLFLERNL